MAESNSSGGIGFASLLAILFIALKLTGQIDWSWFWVLSPIWIPFGIVGLFFIVMMLVILVSVLMGVPTKFNVKRKK